MRRAIEQAWFEQRPLRIEYAGSGGAPSVRRVRLVTAVMERSLTLLNCDDLDKNEPRQFRLDSVRSAELL